MMKLDHELLRKIRSDLGLNLPFLKGQSIPVKNCWHFSTDGNAVDVIFYDEEDFINGMNRIYITVQGYQVVILAFCLMDTHVHFVLYGVYEECNRFMHDYVKRTSRYISIRHGDKKKLDHVPIDYQVVDTDDYLKTLICYVIKNAPVAGIPFQALDYPWSSGSLYFRAPGIWSSPAWLTQADKMEHTGEWGSHKKRNTLKTRTIPEQDARMIGRLVFPGEYVAYEIVEQIYKTCKSFHYFFCRTKEADVDARGGTISHLSIPMQEMRQHKNEVCQALFGTGNIKKLDTAQRLRLARALKSRYNSSLKQIIRLCGLVYDEVKNLI